MQNPVPPNFLLVGSIVTVPMRAWLNVPRHFAIVSRQCSVDGLPIVIANSGDTKGPAERLWTDFTQGEPYEQAYYPSNLSPWVVLNNAYSMFGSRYDLFRWNCEHFANVCHGLPATSRQVQTAALVALVGGAALLAARAA